MKNYRKLNKDDLKFAVMGGTILGGGGGGDPEKGFEMAKIATEYSDLYLADINDIPDDNLLVTAAIVGAPAAKEQFLKPSFLVRAVDLLKKNNDLVIGGMITNENGGQTTVNGWVQAAFLGIPLVDAPCNGRAHPTAIMGGMNLHKISDLVTMHVAVGGNPEKNKYIESVFKGSMEYCSKMVRLASVEAGGMVGVARNPVTVAYAKKNNAIGGITHAIETGKAYYKGLEISPEKAVESAMEFLGGRIIAKGKIDSYKLVTEGGFDIGSIEVDGINMTFWNEYMTVDEGDKRLATFPDLIMTFDADTGNPLPSSAVSEGKEVYIAITNRNNIKLSSTMFEMDLMKQVESIINKPIVEYLN